MEVTVEKQGYLAGCRPGKTTRQEVTANQELMLHLEISGRQLRFLGIIVKLRNCSNT